MADRKRTRAKQKTPGKPVPTDGDSKPALPELRAELDAIDRKIVEVLNRRATIAQQIGQCKHDLSQAVLDPQRESQVIEQAVTSSVGPLPDSAVRAVFRELISGSRAVQIPLRATYLGPEFTFSHLAAIERFGQSAELVPVSTIAAVFEEVERGQSNFGVVPMENSTDGRVTDTLECFSCSRARICGELPLRIHHCLLGSGSRGEVERIYSKTQPLSQCRNWIASHLPKAELRETASTAAAVNAAMKESHSAAIASAQAGTSYGLPVLAENIEDNLDNVTRFAVIATETSPPSGRDKTVLMVEIAHQPGALADAMAIFKRNRLNMTWIESFPIPGARGRYLFFVEFVGHQNDRPARRAIDTLAKNALRLEVLGSYAQTEPVG